MAMPSNYTPGPWVIHSWFSAHVVPAVDAAKKIGFAEDPEIDARDYAKVIHYSQGDDPCHSQRSIAKLEAQANARLIAAAPDLLTAAKIALARLEQADIATDSLIWIHERVLLSAAIAKAEQRR